MNLIKNSRRAIWSVFAAICLTTLLSGSGCGHVTPQTPSPKVVAYSGNEQNAGIVREIPNKGGWEITPGARNRYNSFVDHFGDDMVPPIKKDFGVAPLKNGNFSLTFEAAAKWRRMILLNHRESQGKAGGLADKLGL